MIAKVAYWYAAPVNGLPAEGMCTDQAVQCPCRMPGTQAVHHDPEPVLAQMMLGWPLGLAAAVHLQHSMSGIC